MLQTTVSRKSLDLHNLHLKTVNAACKEQTVDRVQSESYVSSKLSLEGRFTHEIIKELEDRGYSIRISDQYENYYGGVQLIYYDEPLHRYIGVSDPRRGGAVSGY